MSPSLTFNGFWGLNSGPHAFVTSTLPAEVSLQPSDASCMWHLKSQTQRRPSFQGLVGGAEVQLFLKKIIFIFNCVYLCPCMGACMGVQVPPGARGSDSPGAELQGLVRPLKWVLGTKLWPSV